MLTALFLFNHGWKRGTDCRQYTDWIYEAYVVRFFSDNTNPITFVGNEIFEGVNTEVALKILFVFRGDDFPEVQ